MASRWVLGPTGASGSSGTPNLSLIPGLGLLEAAGGSGCDGAVGAVPQGTCAADLYRHPQLDADIEAVKEIYSENAVAVRWVRLLPPAPGSAIPGHAAGPHQEPSCTIPRHPAVLPLGTQLCHAQASSHAVSGTPGHGIPRHLAEPSLRHTLPRTLATVSPGHLAVLSLGTQTWQSWSIQLWQPQALICAIFRHPAVPSRGTWLCCVPGTQLWHHWVTWPWHHQTPGSTIPEVPGCAVLRHPAVPSPAHLGMPFPGT